MHYTKLLPILAIASLLNTHASAQQNDISVQPGDLTLVEAYQQRTMQKNELVNADTHFIVIWRAPEYPRTFAWLQKGRTVNCSFTKATATLPKGKQPQQGLKYYAIKTPANKIAPGDTLDITPLNVLNSTVPIREQQRMNNTIFYTTDSKTMMYTLQVETIGRAEDVVR